MINCCNSTLVNPLHAPKCLLLFVLSWFMRIFAAPAVMDVRQKWCVMTQLWNTVVFPKTERFLVYRPKEMTVLFLVSCWNVSSVNWPSDLISLPWNDLQVQGRQKAQCAHTFSSVSSVLPHLDEPDLFTSVRDLTATQMWCQSSLVHVFLVSSLFVFLSCLHSHETSSVLHKMGGAMSRQQRLFFNSSCKTSLTTWTFKLSRMVF